MKVVIDIPKEHYENLAKIANAGKEPLGYWERVVMRGTPLPKGHGDLIDRKELMNAPYRKGGFVDWYDEIKYASAIIPVDKEVSE